MKTLPTWRDTLLTAMAPVIWGSTYIVTTELLPPGRPFIAAVLRTLPAGLLLTLWCRHIPDRRVWGRLAILGALNIGLFQAMLFIAAYRLPGGLAAVVGAIQPLLVMALGWGIDRQRPSAAAAGFAALGVGGMAVLLMSESSRWDVIGVGAALCGTASMALGTYLGRSWRSDMPVLAFTGWQLLGGGVMLAPVASLVDPPLLSLGAWEIIGYAYLSLFGALLSYTLWFRGLGRISPVSVASLGLLSPATAVVLGWLLLGQSATGLSVLGMFAVLASVLGVQRGAIPLTRRFVTNP